MYQEHVRLRTLDMGSDDRITAFSILSLCQDVAGIHGEMLNVGFEKLQARNIIWVLLRSKFEVVKEPKLFEEVIIETWPHTPSKIDFDRDYVIKNIDGEVLVKATSKWCLVDSIERTILRANKVNMEIEEYTPLYDSFPKIKYDKTLFTYVNKFKVLNHHLDHNGHMNNAYYAEMVYDVLNMHIKEFEINYIKEAHLDDEIDIYTFFDEEKYIMGMVKEEVCFICKVKL